uniref:Uncharacterized AAA domain-containing protein ycf46 n=1 Tax=Flintiella sanguinaria TaxID=101926 RepID=A0A1X9PUP7_9RHOD|nr:conserved hypothetical plastid protein [Flintiella sanguinaria]
MHFLKEFKILLKSRYPLIYISTHEEERLEYTINQLLGQESEWIINVWDFVNGYYNNPNDLGIAARHPLEALEFAESRYKENIRSIFILKDFDNFLDDITIIRKLKNLVYKFKLESKHIITATTVQIPESIKDIITVLEFPLPTKKEIRNELIKLLEYTKNSITNELLNNLVNSCQGLSLEKIRRILTRIIAENTVISDNYINNKFILIEKKQAVNRTQLLELYSNVEKISNIGGLHNLKKWLKLRSNSFSEKAKLYGLPTPKGLLLVGVQGTGKSLTAKAIADEWRLPLLKLYVFKIFSGIVGESEAKIRQMINIAEAMSPCIIWIDEIDKAFTGVYSQGDSGTTTRVFGTLTSWLSEKTSEVFIIATANNIKFIPPELIRKGRFDEIFFVGLPNKQERREIFNVLLNKIRPNTYKNYNLSLLSEITDNFSGAEIEQAIIEGMHIAYNDNRGTKFS